jgi:group I intron endonuclease
MRCLYSATHIIKTEIEYKFNNLRVQGVYKIYNRIDNKCYIGSSTNILDRLLTHNNKCHNYLLRKALREIGRNNFFFCILELVYKGKQLRERENFYIQLYDSTNPEKGYNIVRNAGESIEHLSAKKSKNRNEISNSRSFYDFRNLEAASREALWKAKLDRSIK